MEDLEELLADLESTTNQFKTTYAQTAPENRSPAKPYQQPPPVLSPGSPIYSEIPNGFSPSPQHKKPYPKSQGTSYQQPPQGHFAQKQSVETHLYSEPHDNSYDPISPTYNPNTPPPKPARPRILSNSQPTQEPNYSQPTQETNYSQPTQEPNYSQPTQESNYSQPSNSYQPHHQHNKMANLAELDNLLQDLEAAQFQFRNTAEPPPKPSQFPSNASPTRGPPPAVAPKPKSPVKIVARQNGAPAPPPLSIRNQQNVESSQAPPRSASSATRELDDLMASLSDFKLSAQPTPVPASAEPQYAQPLKAGGVAPVGQQQQNTVQESQRATPQTEQQPSIGGNQLDSMLGHLHSDVSRQGINTVAKGFCAACNKQIVGQIVTALGRTWHPEHFVCSHCEEELGSENFFEREGEAYCENDYHNLFSPRCAYCNGAILGSCITALEKTWHPEHFFCAQCGKPFGSDGFHEKNGKAYCPEDYFDMFAPKCGGCHRAIMDNYITALNVQWHQDCFVCGECRMPFNGGSFFDHNSIPYCEIHYHAVRGSLCAGCSKPITGRCITAMHKKFHPEHFVCSYCMKQLNKGTFKEQNDKPYCHGCFEKLFS